MGRHMMHRTRDLWIGAVVALSASVAVASGRGPAAEVDERMAAASPKRQTAEQALAKSAGCISCHTSTDRKTSLNQALRDFAVGV